MTQKERIVEKAMQMFVNQGIKSVRMDDIAQQLSVSKRTLYELFDDKEHLLYLAMDCYCKHNSRNWNELGAGSQDVLEAMFKVLGNVMDVSEQTHRLMVNLNKFYPAVYEKVMKEGAQTNRASLRSMLERGISDGLFTDEINIDLSISVLYYSVPALVVRKDADSLLPEGMTDREAFVQVITTFFRGISTPKGLALVDSYKQRYQPEKIKSERNE